MFGIQGAEIDLYMYVKLKSDIVKYVATDTRQGSIQDR